MLPEQAIVYPPAERQEIIGLSAPMLQLKKEIDIVAASDLNVLISGETGTGKELVAKAVHQGSPRAANPLVYLNCAALPRAWRRASCLATSKGRLPGRSATAAAIEMADNGTLFLDEIGELSLALQADCYGCCSMAIFSASATIAACGLMCGCWRPPTATCVRR